MKNKIAKLGAVSLAVGGACDGIDDPLRGYVIRGGREMEERYESFGRPEKFCSDVEKTNWESATITTSDDKIME